MNAPAIVSRRQPVASLAGAGRVAAFVVAVAALASLPFVRQPLGLSLYYVTFLGTVCFWVAEATSWNILSGYSGYFSFGQGAFVGVGAYATAVLAGRNGIDFFLTLPVSAALSVLLALVVGAIAFRLRSLRGEIFALLTLAVPFILASFVRINSAIDGGQGIVVPIPAIPSFLGDFQDLLFLLNLALAAAAVGVAWWMHRSRFGWALFAIRDAEDVAESLGVPTFRYKLLAIAISGLIGGLGGSVLALQIGFVTVDSVFGLNIPLFVIVMSLLGGRSHWLGPALGALLIVTLQDRLAGAGFQGWSQVILGSILVVVMIAAPDGLLARLRRRPWQSAIAFVAAVAVLAVGGITSDPIDWLAAAMLVATAVAFVPVPWRRRGVRPRQLSRVVTAPADPEIAPIEPAGLAAPSGVPLVECAGVERRFGGLQALRGIDLEVRPGDLVALVGPNGSGKTTLINLVNGSFRPSAGRIRIEGTEIARLAPHRIAHLGVARTYQVPRPFGSMTVRDNVALAIMFGRRPRSLARARSEAEIHLEVVGLRALADALPSEINLHERQLLEMARAIASAPRVLLLDEALAGLNPAEVDQAVAVVRRIHASGVSIVIVEHLLRVVNQLATRIVVLDGGRVIADGDPAEVMRDPAVVEAYLGRRAVA